MNKIIMIILVAVLFVSVSVPSIYTNEWATTYEPSDDMTDPYHYYGLPPDSFGQAGRHVNWSYFWKLFKQHVDWALEVYNPETEEWVDITNRLNIHRERSPDNTSEKISLNFTTLSQGTLDYRLLFGIDVRVKDYINKSGRYEYVLTYPADETQNYTVFFNWSDMLQHVGLIFKHGIKEIGGKDIFWFMVRKNQIPPDRLIELDPTFGCISGDQDGSDSADKTRGPIASPSSNGTADNITLNIMSGWTSGERIKCALYIKRGANDYMFLRETEEKNHGGSGWIAFNFSEPKPVVCSSTNYAVVFFSDSTFTYNLTEGTAAYTEITYPYWAEGLFNSDVEINIYCSYTMGTCYSSYTIRGLANSSYPTNYGNITWTGAKGTTVWSNETYPAPGSIMTMNIVVNATDNVTDIRVWCDDLDVNINASNISLYISSDYDTFGLLGAFSDGGNNLTINTSNWNAGTMGANPFPLTDTAASVYCMFRLTIPATATSGNFTQSDWKVYIGYI